MTIGEKIKLARSLVGMTSKELAFLSGISEGQIRQYEINIRIHRICPWCPKRIFFRA